MGDGEQEYGGAVDDATQTATAGAGPSFNWAQFPWANHQYGAHSFDVAYTLINEGSVAGSVGVNVGVSLEGAPVHVEDRQSPAVAPGHTWDDHFAVPVADGIRAHDVELHVTSPENPQLYLFARLKSDNSQGS